MDQNVIISTSSFNIDNVPQLKELQDNGIKILLNPYKRRMTEEEVTELTKNNVIGVIAGVEPLSRAVFKASSSLKVISRCGAATDNVDLQAAKELDILVYSTPNAPTEAVCELTIGLMLSVLRKISLTDRTIRSKNWKPVMGSLLKTRTIGIIGLGRIGRSVAKLLNQGFGCNVLGFDPCLANEKWNLMPCTPISSQQELLKQADLISLHIPWTKENKNIIGKEEFQIMKDNAILINTSRGGLVDETALGLALEQGKIAGAGLDVFEKEPYNGPLLKYDNVVMTMHMGSYAIESRIKMEQEAVQNLIKGLKMKGILK